MLKEENNLEKVIILLEEKNTYLQTFLEISEKERKSFKARNFDNLGDLYKIREDILENIRSLDRRIDHSSKALATMSFDESEKTLVRTLLATKESLVNQIMAQDLVMLSCVENEKSMIIRKMTAMRDGRRLLKAYRSMPEIVD